LLLKVYQIIGGGGVHLWACHSLGDEKLKPYWKPIIMFFWVLCGIGRASHFSKYHILHHYYCDKPGDPHSPNDHSALVLTLGLWTLSTGKRDKYITKSIQNAFDGAYRRIASSPIANFMDKYHYAIIFSTLAVSTYLSPFVALYFIALPMFLNIIDGNYFFVYYFHKGGAVRNTPWVDYWIFKSGYHKVHHRWLK
jgi:fatty-acid desaturase